MLGGQDRRTLHLITGRLTGDVAGLAGGAARPCRDRAGGRPGRGLAVSTYAAAMDDNRREARHRHRRHRHQGRSGRSRDGRADRRALPAAHAQACDTRCRGRHRRPGRQALRLPRRGGWHLPRRGEARRRPDRGERRQVMGGHRCPGPVRRRDRLHLHRHQRRGLRGSRGDEVRRRCRPARRRDHRHARHWHRHCGLPRRRAVAEHRARPSRGARQGRGDAGGRQRCGSARTSTGRSGRSGSTSTSITSRR